MSQLGNDAQEARLANLNNMYGVARFAHENGEIHVWDDDGDEAMIHQDGTVSWKMGSDGWKREEIG
jgi:hypothetical protein